MCLHTWVCVCVDSSDGCRNTHAWATVGCGGNQPLAKEAMERTEEVKDMLEVTEGETEGGGRGSGDGSVGEGGAEDACSTSRVRLLKLMCSN